MFKIVPLTVFVNPSTLEAINRILKAKGAYDVEFETHEEAEDFRTKNSVDHLSTEIVEG